ncbi:MAG: hypothetical protein JNL28_07300 [Planctomycetes bacterium]|nr:hypothetical protein [Planctomycetota bacterium]
MKRLLVLLLLLSVAPLQSGCDPEPVAVQVTPLAQAEELIGKRDYPAAIAVLEAVRESGGHDPAVVKRLMELHKAQGDTAKGILCGRAGIAAHPEARELYAPLALFYFEVNQVDEARTLLIEARRLGVGDAEVGLPLGACLARAGDSEGARREFELAQAAGADEKVVQMNIGLLHVQQNETAKALAAFEALSAKYPALPGPKREIARLWLQQATTDARDSGKVDEALVNRAMDMLWNIKDELKTDWRMYEAMGDGWLLLGEFEASVAAYTDALRHGHNPKSVEDRYRVAKQQLNDALKAAAEAAEAQPK